MKQKKKTSLVNYLLKGNINSCCSQLFTFHAFHPKAVNELVRGRSSDLLFIVPSHLKSSNSGKYNYLLGLLTCLSKPIYSYGDSARFSLVSLLIFYSLVVKQTSLPIEEPNTLCKYGRNEC